MSITRYWPYGPHGSVGNDLRGIGDQWRALNAIGVPVFYKGADGYGPLFELMELADQYDIPNVGVFRLVTKGGQSYDVPNWWAETPELAAAQHVQKTIVQLPPEFDKRVWLELINEPDKDDDDSFPDWSSTHFADWLGRFGQRCAELLLPDGYKVAMFGFSAGEPELPDWETDGMLSFLRMCAQKPGRLAVALHEYSYNSASLEEALHVYPWQLGRFTLLFDVCDRYGIERPTVLITEFGWSLNNLPLPEIAIPQLEWAANEIYGPHKQVKGVAVWHYGEGYNNIKVKAQRLLQPMANRAMSWRMEIEGNPTIPPISGGTFEEQAWVVAEYNRILEFMPEAALQKEIYSDNFVPASNEYRQEIDGNVYAGQLAERLDKNEKRIYMALDNDWGNVFVVPQVGATPPTPEPPDPDPEPPNPDPEPPLGTAINLKPYFIPNDGFGPLYELKDVITGAQRRVQTQAEGRHFYITKGTGGLGGKSEWEELHYDGAFIWRGVDTSPGSNRLYVQYEYGLGMARWCKQFMAVGETFVGEGHRVQFFDKVTCNLSAPNSGQSTNVTTLFAHHGRITFNGLTFDDVVELGRGGGERFWFARGIGMIGWKSAWNESYISELHSPGARPNNEREPICYYELP